MKGDFSRDTFDPQKHFTRVQMQQGRVQTDADWNEQQEINRYLLRTFIADLIGPYGTPGDGTGGPGPGFLIEPRGMQLLIHPGHYYVNGILCEQDSATPLDYARQPDYPAPVPDEELPGTGERCLVYLDVWERHISTIADGTIREAALGVVDTCTRAKTVWQVRLKKIPRGLGDDTAGRDWECLVVPQAPRGGLRAWTGQGAGGYRGVENRLYRIEIHDGGGNVSATFKWSRRNGSEAFAITGTTPDGVTLSDSAGLSTGDWVEFENDYTVLHNRLLPLRQVIGIDPTGRTVSLSGAVPAEPGSHPLLRRWDQKEKRRSNAGWKDGCITVVEDLPVELEDGIMIQFEGGAGHRYLTGDYWLIPARVATADIEWPKKGNARPPRGIDHHYAPLALIRRDRKVLSLIADLRSPMRLRCNQPAGRDPGD